MTAYHWREWLNKLNLCRTVSKPHLNIYIQLVLSICLVK